MKPALACLLAILAGVAAASDYPTDPNDRDELCEEIGAAKDASAPPKDRLWFSENCTCEEEIGCGYASSRRFGERRKAAGQAEAKRLDAERKANAARDAEDLIVARETCSAYVACLRENAQSFQACDRVEARFEYDCSSGLRDHEACGRAVDVLRRNPAQADCGSALKATGPGR
jgi:hypothetical protein